MLYSELKPLFSKELRERIEMARKEAAELLLQIQELSKKHEEAVKRYDVIKDFYELEFGNFIAESNKDSENLFEIKPPFKDLTIREACRMVLKNSGPMHVSELQHILEQGGRDVKKTSLTSTMLRGKEFEKVEGEQNTFKLKDEERR